MTAGSNKTIDRIIFDLTATIHVFIICCDCGLFIKEEYGDISPPRAFFYFLRFNNVLIIYLMNKNVIVYNPQ